MKYLMSTLGITLTGALVLGLVGPAHADERTEPEAAVRAASSAQAITPAQSANPALAKHVGVEGLEVTAPTGTGQQIEVELPGKDLPDRHRSDLTTNLSGGSGYSTALQNTGSGTFRALVHIDHPTAPDEYRFELGDDVELIPLEDGGMSVRDLHGELLGVFEPAWAVDADGNAVASSYEVVGRSTLIQHVAVGSTTAFPVVADPFWIPALFVMARITAHVAARAAQRGVSQALIRQVVQNGKKSAGQKGTSVFTQGSGKNRIRVIVDNKSGNIITVTKG